MASLTKITGLHNPSSSAKTVGLLCNADLNASLVIKKRGVRLVLNNEVHIKTPKKVAFSKKLVRRAGTVRSDASASKPVESSVSRICLKPIRSSL